MELHRPPYRPRRALNFLAGEAEGAGVLPGGNSFVTRRLMEEILASGVPETHFRPRSAVRSIVREGAGVVVSYIDAEGKTRVVEAERVVVACPKFIAGYIVDNLSKEQASAMSQLSYNAYAVANLLIDFKVRWISMTSTCLEIKPSHLPRLSEPPINRV